MFCIECGGKIEEGEKFCTNCGNSISELKVVEDVSQSNSKINSPKTPLYFFIFSIILSVIGVVIEETAHPLSDLILIIAGLGLFISPIWYLMSCKGNKCRLITKVMMVFVLIVNAGIISLFGYVLLSNDSYDASSNEETSDEDYIIETSDEEYTTALTELGSLMNPVGYFDDMSLFEADIDVEEWLSHILYFDIEQTAVTNENKAFASVVKIVCEDEDYIYYGSGTNLDPAGYVLTNYHVVEGLAEDACMVGFPDPQSGLIREAYWSTIIIDKENETGHDLAYLAIEEPVFDEKGNIYGYYDKVFNSDFPYFEHTEECLSTAIQLGDELLILGYPPLSGGSLTVTNGLVSSLYSSYGYIVTSAKIVSGNSGGLAIDSKGCYVGVPTAVYYDTEDVNQEQFGEIIDAEFVFDFDLAVEDDLQEYYERAGIVETSNFFSEEQ